MAHMVISRLTREALRAEPETQWLLGSVLEKSPEYMELGSVGPDLPYYGNLLRAALTILLDRPDKPMGVDQWSYQLHSKDPDVFPLKMLEIIRKEARTAKREWDKDDLRKLAFLCGFLTHMAGDQIIHPVVNRIAGPYYKKGKDREKHRTCEVHQDLYVVKSMWLKAPLTRAAFKKQHFDQWCMIVPDQRFRYLLQKAFVEAHAVKPSGLAVWLWVCGLHFVLRHCNRSKGHFNSYANAWRNLFDRQGQIKNSKEYDEYILLKGPNGETRTYDDYFPDAVALASIYIRAAWRILNADNLDAFTRGRFAEVVRNADLGSPLETSILAKARAALGELPPFLGSTGIRSTSV